jgi:hypothetical protein
MLSISVAIPVRTYIILNYAHKENFTRILWSNCHMKEHIIAVQMGEIRYVRLIAGCKK